VDEPAPVEYPNVGGYIRRRRAMLALAGVLSAVGNAAGLVPYIVVYFVAQDVLGTPQAQVDSGRLWTLALVALVAVLVKAACTGAALHVSHIAAYTVLYDLRLAIAHKLSTLPLGYFTSRTTGEIKKVIHEDVEQLEEGLAHMIPDLVGSLTVPIVTLVVLFALDWRLALATIALLPFAFAMYAWVAARSGMQQYNELTAKLNGTVSQYINGMKVLKTFLRADASFEQLRAVAGEMRAFYEGPYSAAIPALAVILTVVRANLLLIVPLGVLLYLGGSLSIPTFVLFLVLGMGFNRPIFTLFFSYGMAVWQVDVASQKIGPILQTPSLTEPSQALEPRDARIEFRGVSFSYAEPRTENREPRTENQNPDVVLGSRFSVLNDVSFTVPAGTVTALVGPSGAASVMVSEPLLTNLRLKHTETPGAAIAVLVDGAPVVATGVGFADRERTTPLPTDAAFYIYSVTKTVIAALVLRLAEDGRLALDQPVQRYLPELPLATPVPLRRLLNHTGGLPDYGALASYTRDLRADPAHPWTPDEFLQHTLLDGLRFAPGAGWAYSNIGYLLLKLTIERITKQRFASVVQHAIAQPLGLGHTAVAESLADARRLTPAYSAELRTDGAVENVAPVYHPGWVSHGVVISTAAELARVLDALFAGWLQPASLQAMLEPVVVGGTHPLFNQSAYGLGLMIDAASPHGTVAGHGGGGPGYSAGAICVPDLAGKRVVTVALANRDVPDLGLALAFRLMEVTAHEQRHIRATIRQHTN